MWVSPEASKGPIPCRSQKFPFWSIFQSQKSLNGGRGHGNHFLGPPAASFPFGNLLCLSQSCLESGKLFLTPLEAHCVPAGGALIFSRVVDTWFTPSGLHPAWSGPKSVKNSVLGHGPLLKPRPKPKTSAKVRKDSLRRQ